MLSTEILLIGGILLVQPLVGVLYLFVLYRAIAGFTAKRAEQAVDGRIEKVKQAAAELLDND